MQKFHNLPAVLVEATEATEHSVELTSVQLFLY